MILSRILKLLVVMTWGVVFSSLGFAEATSPKKKFIPLSMGLNLEEPQTQVKIVSNPKAFSDLGKLSRPWIESIYKRVEQKIKAEGIASISFESLDEVLNPKFVDEYWELFEEKKEEEDAEEELEDKKKAPYRIVRTEEADQKEKEEFKFLDKKKEDLTDWDLRVLAYQYAQRRLNKFPEFGIEIKEDQTAVLNKGSFVYTSVLESAVKGDVPNGIYPLFYDGDVTVTVDGVGQIVSCPAKYSAARQCINIQLTDERNEEGLKITFTAKKKTHLKNYHLIMPTVDHKAVLAGQIIFNPTYMDYIKDFTSFRVMNSLMASPRSPLECVVTYTNHRNKYFLPKDKLEQEYLKHVVNIRLSEYMKEEKIKSEDLDEKEVIKYFKEYKNKDGETFYTEIEMEAIEKILTEWISEGQLGDAEEMAASVKESEEALEPLKEKLTAYRKKLKEFNWNFVDPSEDYGNCLMKFQRTWASRAQLTDQFWGSSYRNPEENWRGYPIEVVVELLKQTKADVWLNVPHNASVDYVENLAKKFQESFDGEKTVFLELSNEIWNGAFLGQKYFIGLAKYHYEHYVTEIINQTKDYVENYPAKIEGGTAWTKQAMKKHFADYEKAILKELDNFKECRDRAEEEAREENDDGVPSVVASADDENSESTSEEDELDCDKFEKVKKEDDETDGEDSGEESEVVASSDSEEDELEEHEKIRYKKKNFFEKILTEAPYLDAYWKGYRDQALSEYIEIEYKEKKSEDSDEFVTKKKKVKRFDHMKANKVELHSPDLVYHLSGDEVRELQKQLFALYKFGWKNRAKFLAPVNFDYTKSLKEQGNCEAKPRNAEERKKLCYLKHGVGFDFDLNGRIHVKKQLQRAYQYMAQMAYVDRLIKVKKIWEEAGYPKEKLVTVLGTKQNNPYLTRLMLKYAKRSEVVGEIDAVAMAAYFYGCAGDLVVDDEDEESGVRTIKDYKQGPCKDVTEGLLAAEDIEGVIEVIRDKENERGLYGVQKQIKAQLKEIKEVTKSDRIKLMAYEGGQHLTLASLERKQRKYLDEHPELKEEKKKLFNEAIHSEEMGEVTRELYKLWEDEGGLVFQNFYVAQNFHPWGSFGLSEGIGVDYKETPRYKAAIEFAEKYKEVNALLEKAFGAAATR